MTTENIIYKPLLDTEDNLKIRLANGEFGFSTSTSAIVFKGASGGTETFRNPDGTSTTSRNWWHFTNYRITK